MCLCVYWLSTLKQKQATKGKDSLVVETKSDDDETKGVKASKTKSFNSTQNQGRQASKTKSEQWQNQGHQSIQNQVV